MKKYIALFALLLSLSAFAQETTATWKPNKKGSFYLYWGWNRDAYTKSDITFTGNDYNFTLNDAIANDRQSLFRPEIYFNPKNISIPQYNLRFGYFFKDKYEISLGVDHMKYVLKNLQTVKMDGTIQNSGTQYDGTYDHTDQVIYPNFLLFEHTDGLNYLNTEIRRSDMLYGNKWFALSANYGGGIGVLMPRTNTTLLNNPRYDQFHLAGFGFGLAGAIRMNFFKYFFIQTEAKYGFINMPDIRTTMHKEDRAKQHFAFMQYNITFGFQFQMTNREKK